MTKFENQKRNLKMLIMSAAVYNFFSVIADQNITNYILSTSTTSKFVIGLYGFLMALGLMMLQFPTSKRLQSGKFNAYSTFYNSLFFDFTLTLLLAISVALFYSQPYFLILFFGFNLLLQLVRGVTFPARVQLIKENFDDHNVGVYFKLKIVYVNIFRLLAFILAYFFLSNYFSVENDLAIYFGFFTLAPLSYLAFMRFFKPSKNTIKQDIKKEQSSFKLAKELIKKDPRYRKILTSSMFSSLSYTFLPFIIVLAREQLDLTFSQVFLASIFIMVSNVIFALIAGRWKFAKNYKKTLTFVRGLGLITLLLMIVIPISKPLIYSVLLLNSLVARGEELAFGNINIIMGKDNSAIYSSVYSYLNNFAKMFGILITGALIDLLGYNFATLFALVLMAISVLLLFRKTKQLA